MKKKVIFLLLALAVAGGAFWKFKKSKTTQANFSLAQVERGTIQVAILATGVAQPQNRLEIKVPIAGRLEEVIAKEGDSVSKGQILAWMSSTERAALLDAAHSKGAEEVAHWEEVYKPAPLVAPMNGIIIARSMEPGQTVTTQDVPLVMSNRLIVKAQVDETDIAKIKIGQPVEISLDAYPGQTVRGRAQHIAFEAKTVNNVTTYEVDVAPLGVPSFMRSGMTANVSFVVEKKENVLWLPQAALRQGEGGHKVFLPKADPKKKGPPPSAEVEVGISDGKKTEIISGLEEGDAVLISEIKWERKDKKDQGSNPFAPYRPRRSGTDNQRKVGAGL